MVSDLAFAGEAWSWLDDAMPLVTADSALQPHALAELLRSAFFSPSDDADSDSWETQRDRFDESALHLATRLLLSDDEACRTSIPAAPFPRWAEVMAERMAPWFVGAAPEQCIVNEYRPGQGIGMHADHADFGPVVASLSLADDWPMQFRRRSVRPYPVPGQQHRCDLARAFFPAKTRSIEAPRPSICCTSGGQGNGRYRCRGEPCLDRPRRTMKRRIDRWVRRPRIFPRTETI